MEDDIGPYAEALERDGFVVIEDYFDDETCDELYEELSYEIEEGDFDVVDKDTQYSYSEFVNWGGPVANKRGDPDDGMIDVFNADGIIPDVKSFKEDKNINEIVDQAASEEYSPDNVNVYWNRSVTNTRDFHADTYVGKFKSFVYLTDVPDESYGPFCYISGSHKYSFVKKQLTKLVNKIRGAQGTDAVFYDEDHVTTCTAPKGTLIIANQRGYHRGHPQEEGKERMVLTTSYTTADDQQ